MSISKRPLCYCSNVHPGITVDQVVDGLNKYTANVANQLNFPIAAGLWFPEPTAKAIIENPADLNRVTETLKELNLTCYTLNAFPYGDFHQPVVKENVYLPDWTTDQRRIYTWNCAQILATLLGEQTEGSISTMPLGFKGFEHAHDFEAICIDQLLKLVDDLESLEQRTGKTIRIAIEPEPHCRLETTPEVIAFFSKLYEVAESRNRLQVAKRFLGICYDVCHQAVEFEDATQAIEALQQADIYIYKVQLSCAIETDLPTNNTTQQSELKAYLDKKYLHQTMAKTSDNKILKQVDLSADLIDSPQDQWLNAPVWRIHYHVPVYADKVGSLRTTRPALLSAINAIAKLPYAPDLEVETYTWTVLPSGHAPNLVSGLREELIATQKLLDNA